MTRHRDDHSGGGTTATGRAPRRAVVRFVVAIGVVVVIIVAGLVAPAALRSYDLDHRITIHCDVIAAEGITRGHANRGIGGPDPRVVISTEDCGELVLWKGVTQDDDQSIAARIDAPGRYDIEVGAGTWHFRGVLRAIGRSPSAFGFEPAS